jgi:hypothetical protein
MNKLYAFKQQKYNIKKPENVPEDRVWLKQMIGEHERDQYLSDNWIVLEKDDYDSYLKSGNPDTSLRVFDIIHPQFKDLHPSKIDFRRHLRSEIYLQKSVSMLPNGRPDRATYSYNGVEICEIKFQFETDSLNFMKRRTELLSYYKKDGERGEQFAIADDFYDMTNPYHLQIVMQERSEARAMIIEQVKAFLNGVLAQFYIPQGWSYPQILQVVGEFWNKYGPPISAWISVASPQFQNLLLDESDFEFLNLEVSPGVTVKNYVLQKTSY